MAIEMDDQTKKHAREILSRMEEKVTAHYFKGENCMFCTEIGELLETIKELAPEGKMEIKTYEFSEDKEAAEKYKIDKIPAIVLEGKKPAWVRFFGIPSGYEFGSLLEGLVETSRGVTELFSEETIEYIKSIDKPLHLQVFITPTCPYCPRSVRQAHAAAILNENIIGDMIEAMEFQELSAQFAVMGVPKTVINEKFSYEGAAPEPMFLEKLKEAMKELYG